MSRIQTLSYDNWRKFKADAFVDLYETGQFHRGRYLFRGQMSADWKLSTSFDRWYNELHRDPQKRTETAEHLLAAFRKECEQLDIHREVRDNQLLLTVLAQHYGLPTRLLDWSESIYIAAFFAFCEAISGGQAGKPAGANKPPGVAIWALNQQSGIWQSEIGVSIVDASSMGNSRLRNQFGKFTISRTPFDCLEDYVKNIPDEQSGDSEAALYQIVIPVSEAKAALADLDAMGISHSRIFPEAVGCAMAAKTRVLLED
jgi:hypothetical protein